MASGNQTTSRAGGARATSMRWRAVEGAGVSGRNTAQAVWRAGSVERADAAPGAIREIRPALHHGQSAITCWGAGSGRTGAASTAQTAGRDPRPGALSIACPRSPLATPSSTSESASASPRGTAVLRVPCVTAAISDGSPIDPTENSLEGPQGNRMDLGVALHRVRRAGARLRCCGGLRAPALPIEACTPLTPLRLWGLCGGFDRTSPIQLNLIRALSPQLP
jgi:hypothetical protein